MHACSYTHTRTQVYTYERGDGVGRAHDLVIQGFIRGVTIAAFPVIVSAGVLYVLVSILHCIVTILCWSAVCAGEYTALYCDHTLLECCMCW